MHRFRRPTLVLLLLAVAGLGALPAAGADPLAGEWRWPTEGRLTQDYGCTGAWTNSAKGKCRHFHNGIDIANRAGTPIRAARSGVVRFTGYNKNDPPGQRAWVVILDHGAGVRTWYAHLQPRVAPGAKRGESVSAGDVIGYMGATGRATGVHLHFGIEQRGKFVDPNRYLEGRPVGRTGGKLTDKKAKPKAEAKPTVASKPTPPPTPEPTAEPTPTPTPTIEPQSEPIEGLSGLSPSAYASPSPDALPDTATVTVFRAPLIWLPSYVVELPLPGH